MPPAAPPAATQPDDAASTDGDAAPTDSVAVPPRGGLLSSIQGFNRHNLRASTTAAPVPSRQPTEGGGGGGAGSLFARRRALVEPKRAVPAVATADSDGEDSDWSAT